MLEPSEPSYSIPQLAKLSGMSKWTLWKLIRDGELEAWMPPGHKRGMRIYEHEAAEKLNLGRVCE